MREICAFDFDGIVMTKCRDFLLFFKNLTAN